MWCKHCNFNTSLNAPLIIKAPGIKGGSVSHSISEFVDIYPTLCELTGIEIPDHLEGESLKNRMMYPNETEEDYAICKYQNGATLIEGNYFYTEWSKAGEKPYARMLYDHALDLDENINISEYPENSELIKQLQEKLYMRWGKDYNNPIIQPQSDL